MNCLSSHSLTARDVACLVLVHAVLCRDRVVVLVHGGGDVTPAAAATGRGRGGSSGGRGGGGIPGRGGEGMAVHEQLGLLERRRVRWGGLDDRTEISFTSSYSKCIVHTARFEKTFLLTSIRL